MTKLYTMIVVWVLAKRQTHHRHIPGADRVSGHRIPTTHAFRCCSMFATLLALATSHIAAVLSHAQRSHAALCSHT